MTVYDDPNAPPRRPAPARPPGRPGYTPAGARPAGGAGATAGRPTGAAGASARATVPPEPTVAAAPPADPAPPDPAVAAAKEQVGLAGDELKAVFGALAEAKDYALYWLSAKVDGASALARNLALLVAFAAAAAVVALALLATAAVLLLVGVAAGLTILFDGRAWAGSLVTGLLVLFLVGAGFFLAATLLKSSARRATERRYAEQVDRQRRAHDGHDVNRRADEQRAADAAAERLKESSRG